MIDNPSSGNAHVGIMRDGNIMVTSSSSSSWYPSASASAVVEMEPLDQVYCWLLHGQLHSDPVYPLHFVGYLLYSLE